MRLYQVDDGWVVADEGGWLPGLYVTGEAAEKAVHVASVDFPALEALNESRGRGDAYQPITVDDLAALDGGDTP